MKMKYLEILISSAITALILFYVIYLKYISKSKLECQLKEHYKQEGFTLTHIYKFSINDRLRYRESLPSFVTYTGMFSIKETGHHYYRVIELKNSEDLELTKYVEIYVFKGYIWDIRELDSYTY